MDVVVGAASTTLAYTTSSDKMSFYAFSTLTTRLLAVLSIGAGVAQASIIFSNFSATPPGYANNSAFNMYAIPAPPPVPSPIPPSGFGAFKSSWGMGFVLNQDAILNSASLPLNFEAGDVRVSLMESINSDIPDTVIDSFVVTSGPISRPILFTGSFSNRPILIAGQSYWLVASIDGTAGSAGWFLAYPLFTELGIGPIAQHIDSKTAWPRGWLFSQQQQAAFQLEGQLISAVPEPAVFGITGMGLILAALSYRRRRCRRDARGTDE